MFAIFPIIALCAAIEVEPGYTVHVRELTAPEKVIRLQRTDLHCMVDAVDSLKRQPGDLERMDMWIVRRVEGGKTRVLRVDLTAITQRGSSSTNYQIFDGDRLFLQARPAK